MFSASGAAYLQVDMHATQGGGGCTVVSVYQPLAFDLSCRGVFENLHADLSSRVRWRAFLGDKTGFFAAWAW